MAGLEAFRQRWEGLHYLVSQSLEHENHDDPGRYIDSSDT